MIKDHGPSTVYSGSRGENASLIINLKQMERYTGSQSGGLRFDKQRIKKGGQLQPQDKTLSQIADEA